MVANKGFSIIELMVVVFLFTIISSAGSMLLLAGQSAWTVTDAHIQMRSSLSRILQYISSELQESGTDSAGALQVTILDNVGLNNTDILRFSVPICPCGIGPIDTNGDTRSWGAPLTWGQAGCGDDYPVGVNNKVTICHVPPGNPNNTQTINVSVNAVKTHLAHDDWVGDCNSCTPVNYTNRFVEYRLGANTTLLRRVLDGSLAMINETTVAENVTNLQANFNAGRTVVTVNLTLIRSALQNRQVTKTGSAEIYLRNRG